MRDDNIQPAKKRPQEQLPSGVFFLIPYIKNKIGWGIDNFHGNGVWGLSAQSTAPLKKVKPKLMRSFEQIQDCLYPSQSAETIFRLF